MSISQTESVRPERSHAAAESKGNSVGFDSAPSALRSARTENGLFRDRIAAFKPLVFSLCLLPLAAIAWDTWHGALGTDPVAQLEHRSGDWALRLLLATLAITPLRRLTGWNKAIRFRRMLGLFAFFYVTVHLTIYLVVDLGGFWSQLLTEIAKRPYITVGFTAWLLLIPLALTSTQGMMRRMGRNWQRLHKLVYVIALLGVLHFLWLVKADHREPAIYLGVLILLLLLRVPKIAQGVDRLQAKAKTASHVRYARTAARSAHLRVNGTSTQNT